MAVRAQNGTAGICGKNMIINLLAYRRTIFRHWFSKVFYLTDTGRRWMALKWADRDKFHNIRNDWRKKNWDSFYKRHYKCCDGRTLATTSNDTVLRRDGQTKNGLGTGTSVASLKNQVKRIIKLMYSLNIYKYDQNYYPLYLILQTLHRSPYQGHFCLSISADVLLSLLVGKRPSVTAL